MAVNTKENVQKYKQRSTKHTYKTKILQISIDGKTLYLS
jgi:hypothetical protein